MNDLDELDANLLAQFEALSEQIREQIAQMYQTLNNLTEEGEKQ